VSKNYELRTMNYELKYVIFETAWGYFGLAAGPKGLLRTSLPMAKADSARVYLLAGLHQAEFIPALEKPLQEQIRAYFRGSYVDFGRDIAVDLEKFSNFGRSILSACRGVTFGQKATYVQLAQRAGFTRAGRAAGNILARNPLPLIIPCHRIIRSDGKIGGFTTNAPAGLKKRLLQLEKQTMKALYLSV